MESEFRLYPRQASSFAEKYDQLNWFLVSTSFFFVALICALIIFFAIKYRRRPNAVQPKLDGSKFVLLEIGWSIVPLVISMVMFGWGVVVFLEMERTPAEHEQFYTVGKQWMWKNQHPNGKQEINDLHIPVGETIEMKMISEDVIHSFFIPDFRIKQDVLPGRYTYVWFKPTRVGEYHLFCTEYCGTSHSEMIGTVHVMEAADYAEWLNEQTSEPADVAGKEVFEKYHCNNCHLHDGGGRGPSLVGILGKERILNGGRRIVADEEYIRESIFDPNEKIAAGHQAVMPTFANEVSEDEVLQLISYLESLEEKADQAAYDNKKPNE
ncbi:cytochrome c oxidase subunit II [Thalassoroseus pseudoceratinae]|uniref:cytochrome c oxidase subunit II n=1 Tax=Thalassoroseus pseudoceratinae TaxID=2713176 RepID=UPI0014246DA8|nr:cytochrome c oxidase subunit II [Thalassoroseus pseudoceratinae]